jgi:hypothetical protein
MVEFEQILSERMPKWECEQMGGGVMGDGDGYAFKAQLSSARQFIGSTSLSLIWISAQHVTRPVHQYHSGQYQRQRDRYIQALRPHHKPEHHRFRDEPPQQYATL